MNADVEKAVAWIDSYHGALPQVVRGDWKIIRQALRDQEAEIARLRGKVARYATREPIA